LFHQGTGVAKKKTGELSKLNQGKNPNINYFAPGDSMVGVGKRPVERPISQHPPVPRKTRRRGVTKSS